MISNVLHWAVRDLTHLGLTADLYLLDRSLSIFLFSSAETEICIVFPLAEHFPICVNSIVFLRSQWVINSCSWFYSFWHSLTSGINWKQLFSLCTHCCVCYVRPNHIFKSMLHCAFMWSVSHRLLCLSAWFPDGGPVWGGTVGSEA